MLVYRKKTTDLLTTADQQRVNGTSSGIILTVNIIHKIKLFKQTANTTKKRVSTDLFNPGFNNRLN